MNKRFLYLAVAIMTMFIASCEKDTDDTVVIEVVGIEGVPTIIEVANKDIAKIKIFVSAVRQNSQGQIYFVNNVVATTKIENGSIKLNFPATVPEKYLGSMHELFSIFSYEGITVSDRQAKTGDVRIYAYNSAGRFIGDFRLWGNEWFTEIKYSDRSFTEKGCFQSGREANSHFNKGLNIVYFSLGSNTKTTTQKPLNDDFRWVLWPPPTVGL